ncbi:carnosine synthase 1-like [Mizuhopecten yessoensis]|uniref:carnosine synthase 1-like n=1 Tax=Mizuhopecten yessoensis TaxID=6573 RepID=UPI000B45C110|nr:carnosine synthase 1-like [Mizuhopecten yessoensis]
MNPLDKNSLSESERDVLDGKTILVLGDDQINRKWIRTTLKNYGIKLILVDHKPSAFSSEDVYKYIQYDFTDHQQDEIHAARIIAKLAADNFSIDGCCTFTDACGVLAAYLCEKLELIGGVGVTAANIVWNKSLTQTYLQEQTEGVPRFPRTYTFTGRTASFACENTLRSAMNTIGFPAVCKPNNSAHANGVMLIRKEDEGRHLYKKLATLLEDGKSMMLMEYFDGTEHDIEVIIYQGEIIAAIVSNNGPTRPGCFVETSMSMPSCLPPTKVAELKKAASDCCNDIGLRNGVFNVEMKLTSTGPKLLEINGRMGGNYVRSWMHTCYGFDLLWYVIAIAAGIRPNVPKENTTVHMMGITCALPVHQQILSHIDFGIKATELVQSGAIQFFGEKNCGSTENNPQKSVPFCNVAVVKHDLQTAKSALLHVCDILGIHTALFDVPTYLSEFVPHQ